MSVSDKISTETAVDPDPVTTEVVRHALNAAAEQMKLGLVRAAFSPAIYDILDCTCAIYDRRIRLLGQAETLPLFLGTAGYAIASASRQIGGEQNFEDGDVIISTYGYDIGSHQQDMTVITPAFYERKLVGYAISKAHHMDIGAKDPYCTDTIDIFQEGAIFPSVKLYRAGVLQEEMYRVLLANSRLPQELSGDLNAQIGANRLGAAELLRLIERYGLERFETAVERMFDHGETLIRNFIEKLPDGKYSAEAALDSNGITNDLVPFTVVVEVAGDEVLVDLSEASPQQEGPINCPRPAIVGAARIAVMAIAGGKESVNEGHFRPITVRTQPKTIFEPVPPAPIYMYAWPAIAVVEATVHAFAQASPDAVTAGSGGDICTIVWWGNDDDGVFWAEATDDLAGQGATSTRDGTHPLMHISCSGVRNTPVELWESRRPFIVEMRDCATDSGGAGRFRGGPGMDIRHRALRDCYITVPWERTRTPPWGLMGGHEGRPNRFRVTSTDGSVKEYGKVTRLFVPAGALLELETGGGGGFGSPEERDPRAVHADILEGYVSLEAAKRDYSHAFIHEL